MSDVHKRAPLSRSTRIDLVVLCALVAVGAVVLGAFAWSRPTTTFSPVSYRQSGSLSYSAPTAGTSVYGPKGVVTGDPVYLSKVSSIQLKYGYQFAAEASASISGTERLLVRVTGDDGLTRTVPLQAQQPFHGDHFSITQTLSLSAVRSVAAAFQSVGQAGGSYTVSVVPDISVRGTVAGRAIATTFREPTPFVLSQTALTPGSRTSGAATTGAGPTATAVVGKPITETSTGSIAGASSHPTALLAGLNVADARILAIALVAAALAAACLLLFPMLREDASADERVRIEAKCGASLVPVDALPESPSLAVVELCSFDGLMQVGRRLECPILHLRSGVGDEYAVVDNGTVYRYRLNKGVHELGGRRSANHRTARHVGAKRGLTDDAVGASRGSVD